MFPGKRKDEPLNKNDLWTFWTKTRDVAGIVADARLHDLRHAHASHAVMNGESLHVAGRLLGPPAGIHNEPLRPPGRRDPEPSR